MKKFVAVLFALCLAACASTQVVTEKSAPQVDNTKIETGPIARAEAEAGGVKIILYDTPCTSAAVLGHLKPEVTSFFQRAQVATNEGRTLDACYRNYPEQSAIFLMDEDGDYGAISMTVFHPHQPL